MFMYNIILFVYYFTETTFGLQCWQCISNDCDGDPEKNFRAEKVTCKKDGSCLVRVMQVKVISCCCVLLKGKSCYTSFLCHICNHNILCGMYHSHAIGIIYLLDSTWNKRQGKPKGQSRYSDNAWHTKHWTKTEGTIQIQ